MYAATVETQAVMYVHSQLLWCLQAALKGAKVTVEELLSQHKKQEEGRWEVGAVAV